MSPHHAAPRSAGWWARRAVIALVVGLQLMAAAYAYHVPTKVFGWQMFNASSDWRAEIVRITSEGERHDVQEPWPGGYAWGDLVTGRGLDHPFVRIHASAGLDSTFNVLQHALDYVATNTPSDDQTVRLETAVTYWDNGRGPFERVFSSISRPEASR